MGEIIYTITLIVYAIFIVRFILSWIGGDFELDADLDISDLVSFKGFLHFLMGFTGWLSTKKILSNNIEWYDYIIAFVVGLIFIIILFFVYKLMLKLESKPKILMGKDLIGKQGRVYICDYYDINNKLHHYTVTVNNGVGTIEVSALSEKSFFINSNVVLYDFDGSYYLIK